MRKILISILLSPLFFGLTLVPGYLYGNVPKFTPGSLAAVEPDWWSNGLPLPIYVFGDCPSGCITEFKTPLLIADLLFWFILSYLTYFIFSKSISFLKR